MNGESADPTAEGSATAGSSAKSPNDHFPSGGLTTGGLTSQHPPPPRPSTIFNPTVSSGEDQRKAAALQGVREAHSAPLSPTAMSNGLPPLPPTQHQHQQQKPALHSPTVSLLSGPDFSTPHPSSSAEIQAKIGLLEVLQTNPLESEAEAYVLRSIEAREEQAANTGSAADAAAQHRPSLLGTVPDHAKPIFSNNSSANINHTHNKEDADPLISPLRSRTFSTSSQQQPTLSFASGGVSKVKKKAFLQQQQQNGAKSTMEETLEKLTGQLQVVHNQEQKRFGLSSVTSQMVARDRARLLVQDPGTAGSGDRLGQAATVMLRKTTAHNNGTSPESTTDTGVKARWGKLRTSIVSSDGRTGGGDVGTSGGTNTEMPSANEPTTMTTPVVANLALSDPTANWRKLRLTVTTSAAVAAGRAKKDDDAAGLNDLEMGDEGVMEEEEGDAENYFEDDEMDESKHRSRMQRAFGDSLIGDLSVFAKQRQKELWAYIRLVLFAVFPGIGLACILFYWGDNTPTGIIDRDTSTNDVLYNRNGDIVPQDQASYSWWVLFIGVRQLLAMSLAKLAQVLFIDFFCLNTRIMTKVFGQLLTLLIVQSRGWPFLIFSWSCINFGLNYGSTSFHKHWAYWQDVLEVFNDVNPSGGVPDNDWYFSVLIVAICWGGAVALKRLWLGLYLGRKTYTNYAEDLARVMQKILLLCEVAALGREMEQEVGGNLPPIEGFGITRQDFNDMLHMYDDENTNDAGTVSDDFLAWKPSRSSRPIISPSEVKVTGSFTDKHKSIINELLGAWEEPDREVGLEEVVSISGILQFRQSLQYLESTFFFSIAWGDVGTREKMIISSQNVYRRLMCRLPKRALLSFDVLALCCVQGNGSLDLEAMKTLIKLLRPDRDGKLTMIDFVKSVDTVYKEAKLLRASVKNSERIDRAFERVINVGFYALLFIFTLPQLGFDPLAVFLSMSSIIVGFAFMIGPAASKMFEGWLFILLRRPYDIGDRIHIALPNTDPGPHGSASWFVRDVDLFTTTCVFAGTGEKATLNNGSLAMFRVVNLARSPNPCIHVEVKFAVDTPLSKIQIFEEAVRKFVQSRPREWAQFLGFRPSSIMQEQSYVEYKLLLQHRETWQNAGALGTSKAEVASFCLELTKKLDMKYTLPAMPVELSMSNKAGADSESMMVQYRTLAETAGDDVAAMFLPGTS